MAYTRENYPTKKAMRLDVAAGKVVTVFQPGGIFSEKIPDGVAFIEGPHYPQPHKWYARVAVKDNRIVKILS